MRFLTILLSASVLLCFSFNTLCAQEIDPGSDIPVIEVSAVDFAFAMPSEIPSGWVTLKFKNVGQKTHVAQINHLQGNISQEEFYQILKEGSYPPINGVAGGPGFHAAGEASEITLKLEPGTYAMVCGSNTKDGVPHYAMGMVRHITVTEESGSGQPPAEDMTINLDNYALDIEGELSIGRQTIQINGNNAYYDLHLIALNDSSTQTEAFDYFSDLQDPTSTRFLSGVEEGYTTYITVDLQPGKYMWSSHEFGEYGMYQRFEISESGEIQYLEASYAGAVQMLEASVRKSALEMNTEIEAGRKNVQVTAGDNHDHQLEISRLKDGFSEDDFRDWIRAQKEGSGNPGPVPVHYASLEFDTLTNGETTSLQATFTPGTYLIYCSGSTD